MANSADPDQLASSDLDLDCLQMQGISGFSMTRVKTGLIVFFLFSSQIFGTLIRYGKTKNSYMYTVHNFIFMKE